MDSPKKCNKKTKADDLQVVLGEEVANVCSAKKYATGSGFGNITGWVSGRILFFKYLIKRFQFYQTE